MIQKINLGLTLVLTAFVIYLFVNNSNSTGESEKSITSSPAPVVKKSVKPTANIEKLPIAMVNADSVQSNFLFVKEKNKILEDEQKRAEKTIEAKIKGVEARFMQLQQKAQTMSQTEAEAAQMELQQMEQEVQQLRFKLSEEFEKKGLAVQKEYFKIVNDYLKEYNKVNRYAAIFTFTEGGTVLYADSTIDITQEIVEGLNATYKNTKNKK